MRAIVFPERNLNPNGPILRGMIKAAQKNGWAILGLKGDKDYKINLKPFDSAVIFTNKPRENFYYIDTKCKIGWWMCDLRSPNAIGKLSLIPDNIFLCNEEFINEYSEYYKTKTTFMPQSGVDDKMIPGRDIEGNLVFIGGVSSGYHANRGNILGYLKTRPDLNFWFINGEGTTKDQKYIYRNTDFCLAISPPAQTYTSNRLYNILSSGGFCLTLYFPGIEKLFKNHEHLVWFKQKEEIPKIVKYYTENKTKYNKIRRNGLKLYNEKHTAEHRLNNMFDILEGKCDNFKGFL